MNTHLFSIKNHICIHKVIWFGILCAVSFVSCKLDHRENDVTTHQVLEKRLDTLSFHQKYMEEIKKLPVRSDIDTDQMKLIPGGTFRMGASSPQARPDEFPQHKRSISSFYMDSTEVSNKQFREFIEATGYVTTAERPVDAYYISQQTGVNPAEIDTDPVGVVFIPDPQMWWQTRKGANWKHPEGPESSIDGKENHPVRQVSWYDAVAYAHWNGKRLPTEAEYEYAARGGKEGEVYFWGNTYDKAIRHANFWQGNFPETNSREDQYQSTAPVGVFVPNAYGLYDIAGNVWEWCLDTYHNGGYIITENLPLDQYYSLDHPTQVKVTRGGSYLCSESYCTGYRVSARMYSAPDTSLEHTGFRCVRSIE